MDCERSDCLICSTDSSKKGSCRTRNVLYETFCITCKREEEERERQRGGEVDDAMEKEASEGENEIVKARQENEANDTPVSVEADLTFEKKVVENVVEIPIGSKTDDVMENEINLMENEVMNEREEDEANDTPVYVEADSTVVHITKGSSNIH